MRGPNNTSAVRIENRRWKCQNSGPVVLSISVSLFRAFLVVVVAVVVVVVVVLLLVAVVVSCFSISVYVPCFLPAASLSLALFLSSLCLFPSVSDALACMFDPASCSGISKCSCAAG